MSDYSFGEHTLPDLDSGAFEAKLSKAVRDVALAVIANAGSKGRVRVDLDMKQLGDSHQISMTHALTYEQPTRRGSVTEKNTTQSVLHVNRGGSLTLIPDTQMGLSFDKEKTDVE